MRIRGILIFMIGLGVGSAQAVTFRAGLADAGWQLESSRFACRLHQYVPSYGLAQFEHEAGSPVNFTLTPTQKQQHGKNARLIAEAAPWSPGMAPEAITHVNIKTDGSIEVDGEDAIAMLAALYRGMNPTFSSPNWYKTQEPVKVGVSAVNFKSAYNDYLSCVAQLLPANFRQISRTALLFPSAGWKLSDAAKERLNMIVEYVLTDKSVESIYVDGHSDNWGRRLLNRDLSKQRADAVTAYLVEKGIPADKIVTRYHGERYPVVPNTSAENRARNRRVTIRLERAQ